MHRYFIQLAYNGSSFHGWQIQPNAISVQAVLEKALTTILRQPIEVVGAGRTDAGVHASFFVAHFQVENELKNPEQLVYKLNGFLPNSINIERIFEVDTDLHARFSATSRTYRYFISNKKEPFRDAYIMFVPCELDIDLMNNAAAILLETVDFTSFSKLHTDVKTNNCEVSKAEWFKENGLLVFEIKADRFLRNMVRAVVGTLIDVGKKKITIEEFRQIIEKKDRGVAGASVLAKALFLVDITYPDSVNSLLIRKIDTSFM